MESINYTMSLSTFYLKGVIGWDRNFITFTTPNTILGSIPFGSKTERFTVSQIASVSSDFNVKPKQLGTCFALIVVMLFLLRLLPAVSLVMLPFIIVSIIDSFRVDLIVSTTSGQKKPIRFFIFEKSKAALAEEQINAMISDRMDSTRVQA